jgi:hypothetical protein
MEVRGNHFAQLIVPLGLFAPQPVAAIAALLMIVHQLWLILSGNFAWLNWLTLAIAVVALDDAALGPVLPLQIPPLESQPFAYSVALLVVTALLVVLSYWPLRNLLTRGQVMNSTYNSLHLVNSYGAFGSITRHRNELAVEGTRDAEIGPKTVWHEYAFKAKPGDPKRRPPQIAPYHLRLDWLMWFAALSPSYAESWLMPMVVKLLENDGPTLRLLGDNPFADEPPRYVRISLYRYLFSSPRERRETGATWVRRRIGTYLSPIRLRPEQSAASPHMP